jgi:hypothetical protein
MKLWQLASALVMVGAVQAEVGVSLLGAQRFGEDPTVESNAAIEIADSLSIDEALSTSLTIQYFDTESTSYDFWFSRAESDASSETTTVSLLQESIHFGGRKYWKEDALRPYVGATVGLQQLSVNTERDNDETLWGFTLFAGIAFPISESLQFVGEARMVGTVLSSDTALGCGPSGCVWHIQSQVWSQYDVGLGLSMQF